MRLVPRTWVQKQSPCSSVKPKWFPSSGLYHQSTDNRLGEAQKLAEGLYLILHIALLENIHELLGGGIYSSNHLNQLESWRI